MSETRTLDQRRTDVVAALEQHEQHGWLATADSTGRPHLIAVASWWDGGELVIATKTRSRTARNLDATGRARLAVGSPDDAIVLDTRVSDSVPADEASSDLREGFQAAQGWDPAEQEGDWRFFRLVPVDVQAFRGYGELAGRYVMRDSRWV